MNGLRLSDSSQRVGLQIRLRQQTFFPGNIVEGVVELAVHKSLPYCGIRLKFVGKETVRLAKEVKQPIEYDAMGRAIPSTKEPKTISTHESFVYTKTLITLAGDLKRQADVEGALYKGEHKFDLPPGRYSYPFAWQLPKNIPGSFSKTVGLDVAEIVFYIKAYVARPGGDREVTKKVFINIVRAIPKSQWIPPSPFSVDKVFTVSVCCCVKQGSVACKLSLPRTLLAMERDNLELVVDFDCTLSKQDVLGVIFWLSQRLTYVVDNKQKSLDIARLLAEKEKRRRSNRLGRVGDTVNPQLDDDALLTEEKEMKALGVGKAQTHVFEVARRHMDHRVAAGQKGSVNCLMPLPRDMVDASFASHNIKSEYILEVELLVPYAEDTVHSFPDVISVVQATDVSNTSKPCYFRDAKYSGLPKGGLDCPEVYYNLPPDSCGYYNPVPFECSPVIPRYEYALQPCPVGLPGPLWQRVLAKVGGQETEFSIEPPAKGWKVGAGQFTCPDVSAPPVEGYTFKLQRTSAGGGVAKGTKRSVDEGLLTASALPEEGGAEEDDDLLKPLVVSAAASTTKPKKAVSLYQYDDEEDPMLPFSL
jgi:hypothetical protein